MAWWLKITNSDWNGSYLIVPERSHYRNRKDAESAAAPLLKDPKFTVEFLNKRPKFKRTGGNENV